MSKTPLTDLLRVQAAQPTPAPSSGNAAGWLLTLCLAAALALLVWNKFSGDSKPVPDDDRKEQVEPDAKLDLKKHVLVVIRDKKTLNDDIEYTLTMQDDQFWGWAKANMADVEVLEDEDEIAKALLQNVSERPPVVVLRNTESRKIIWTMPLPKGTTDPIRSKLK